jgi:hypothetical protein
MPYLRLRQVCLVARALEPAVADLAAIFGLAVCHRDGNVAKYGLVNALLPIGTSFLEVVAPTEEGTAAGRYLTRRGGDGGYMVILDCDDIEGRRRHVESVGMRIANALHYEAYTGLQLHPRDTGGAMLELNHTPGGERLDGPYHPAGPRWQDFIRSDITKTLLAVEIQGPDPESLALRWSKVLERPLARDAAGAPEIRLDFGSIRFVRDTDGRGEGLGGVDLRAAKRAAIFAEARERGYEVAKDTATVCGTRFRVVEG